MIDFGVKYSNSKSSEVPRRSSVKILSSSWIEQTQINTSYTVVIIISNKKYSHTIKYYILFPFLTILIFKDGSVEEDHEKRDHTCNTEREPILSHHEAEPQEKHSQPSAENAEPKHGDILTGEDRSREEGEIKVQGKWEFPGSDIWDGIREAKKNGHFCPQHMYYKPDVWIGEEDCLWLNVFSRDLAVNKKRPVIVWIHGGNFVRGSAADYEPDYLLDEDIVLVTIQYRLGMFGFLSSEDQYAPGNYGMLDQVAALQWVKTNIDAFSGDVNHITIMGQQAGGASVHYHMLSSLSRGLFHRAISLSGSALSWWASLKRPLERAKKLARLLECPYDADKSKEMIECIRGIEMEKMMNTHPNFYEWKHLNQNQEPVNAWSPRLEISQHVPWIAGITDDEGAFKGSAFFSEMRNVREFEEDFEKIGPLMFGFHDGQSEAPKMMARKVMDYYWNGKELTKENAKSLVDALSDSSYAHPVDTASKIQSIKSQAPVYVYHFGYKGVNSLTQMDTNSHPPQVIQRDIPYGVGNGDDLIYLFPILSGAFRPLPHDDLIFSQRFIQLFTSFATDGKPVIKMGEGIDDFVWHPVDPNNATHLDIGNEMRMDLGLPNHERMNFWQSMPVYWNSDRENYKPAPPLQDKDEL
ncbi:Liver carboxylesterase 1,Putative inactive carboxylesterase 4,Carboxylesterase 1E,Carboxylesterase 1D,Esterase B1,Esterase CM06B1,Liver carboxylesterase B-1,Cholinesterase 1,Acetylcholinesterase,Cholinesterase 2,Acetylcholinesterase 1 [Lepeophtheirus salmonis]|uniref:Carboxylesterase type B domain-containing protein n=1 Tax=Lepeophtheirus salmonis TaxID=72036 RepID=A0A7R8CGH6_LEPSM|nr:Liver carboxylesterase 1,Putative inactive carboxylesterase 4,Carboxylesterase 1E,Carboxylesterase 1D,Esterase B1,Esterase CM06B1,Liver carboxylesterase B-1,Cholinesterase 1,Acetylcholinesterase,Cholinesterase 2,Acetylcholinesterase 1 [Lepeophtheirus salmonis]CAF2810929.1 Liver carboxylesterase 1,Putative inactive carboxylesterase 4,Carboxylesterase 1E,Carboxylesterase 1D,Esterase B1,Esterase CM06B1,Liver carboxylesterase B-1,Cholinesterase 1,Acetylcholinesterase,Cholinesterase 2,Acetylcholines